MLGGITFGSLSERIGRKKAIMLASFLALPVLPLDASMLSVGIGLVHVTLPLMVLSLVAVMERIDGGEVASPFTPEPYGAHRETLGEAFFTALGRLAAHEATGTPLAQHLPMPGADDAWRVQLDYWEGVIDDDDLAVQDSLKIECPKRFHNRIRHPHDRTEPGLQTVRPPQGAG